MKKTISILMALVLVAAIFAGCQSSTGNTPATENTTNPTTEPTQPSSESETPSTAEPTDALVTEPDATPGTDSEIPGIIAQMYEDVPVDLPLMEPVAVDLTNPDLLSYNTGLTDASLLEEAYVSESMIGSQAYSLVVVSVADGVSAEEVAKEMEQNINPQKWICVEADEVKTAFSGKYAMLIMVNTQFSTEWATQLVAAFERVCAE